MIRAAGVHGLTPRRVCLFPRKVEISGVYPVLAFSEDPVYLIQKDLVCLLLACGASFLGWAGGTEASVPQRTGTRFCQVSRSFVFF